MGKGSYRERDWDRFMIRLKSWESLYRNENLKSIYLCNRNYRQKKTSCNIPTLSRCVNVVVIKKVSKSHDILKGVILSDTNQ